MTSFWRIFWLELVTVVRTRTLTLLLLGSVAWMFVAPLLFTGDGTPGGARELSVRYSLGGVAALAAVSLLMSAAGSVSSDRASRRLQLTLVRPVRPFVIALGRIAALTATGALVIVVAAAIELARSDDRPCRHILRPVLPSPMEEAEEMYKVYMANPQTPEVVRRTKKSVILDLLAQRAIDHYATIGTNTVFSLQFPAAEVAAGESLAVRLRLTNVYEMRDDVCGVLRYGDWSATVSNMTQSVLELPLSRTAADGAPADRLSFHNLGRRNLMLRPRRDIEVLAQADAFGWNLLRASVQLVALLGMLISFGVFLGSALGRPTALFTALVVLLLSEMTPSVVELCPPDLNTKGADAIGLQLTRFAAAATHPVSSVTPMTALSLDECIERSDAARTAALGLVVFPMLFAALSAAVMRRKQEGGAA